MEPWNLWENIVSPTGQLADSIGRRKQAHRLTGSGPAQPQVLRYLRDCLGLETQYINPTDWVQEGALTR